MDSHKASKRYNGYTVEKVSSKLELVFEDFKRRRAGLIKALTTEFLNSRILSLPSFTALERDGAVPWIMDAGGHKILGTRWARKKEMPDDAENFYNQCDPDKENLCLYGFPNGEWKVNLPAEDMPSELPEPSLGINFARPGMPKTDWLSLVAAHSDSWLFGVALYYGGVFEFNKSDRERLFNMINELPTLLEVVTDAAKKQVEVKSSVSNHSGSKSKSNSIAHQARDPRTKRTKALKPKVVEVQIEEDDENILCNICFMHHGVDSFWIFCDYCDHWFHGKCVKVTASIAAEINKYKCPFCRVQFK
ncbi:PHD finger protein alfin-like 3-like [Trifolium pratense]|uniref:PHD finger protein ALFIN-LIKE n=1 Tax=Trifolium pratense TaxID=57577 RepID=A0A2K3NUT3_TRIPR|nr:PHD finger protein alfin-like 3-like [Trifolium pratense]